MERSSGHSILSVDPTGKDRIRYWTPPELAGFRQKSIGSDLDFIGIFETGFRTGLRWTRPDRLLSDPTIGFY